MREKPTLDTYKPIECILMADDETAITDNLAPFFRRAGFVVAVASDGETALRLVSEFHPDLVILDVLMPRLDGREVLRRMRRASNWTPVILLTQIGSPAERAAALDEGADDYLNKPFEPYELLARIRAVLRRSRPGTPLLASARCLRANSLRLDRQTRRATLAGQPVHLGPKCVSILEYLMLHPGEVVSRERLLDAIWGWDYPATHRTVDNRIAELRRALNDDAETPRFIETLTGQGYCFIGPVEAEHESIQPVFQI